jgi:transposase
MRKQHSKEIKFKAALEAIQGDLTIAQIVSKYEVSEGCLHKWKKQLLEEGKEIFASKRGPSVPQDDRDKRHAAIGRLKLENDFLERALATIPSKRG